MCRCALAIVLLLAPLASGAQGLNPYSGDSGAIRVGAALFAGQCAACHKPDGKGISGAGPDLTALWTRGATDERVFSTIRWGVSETAMPANALPDRELWAIVAYLESLGAAPPWPRGVGDPERGRAVFAAECARCHRLHGRGGKLGPDLSTIAAAQTREAVERAVREPSAAVTAGYRSVTLLAAGGERVRGIAKSEDAFSIQIIDTNERLRGFRKAELRAVDHEQTSLMAELGPVDLSDAALEDLLAYLHRETAGADSAARRGPSTSSGSQ